MAISIRQKIVLAAILFYATFAWTAAAHAAIIKPANNLGLAAYWSFDEGSGTTAADHSGHGNKVTLTGGASWDVGKIGQALKTAGSGQYAQATAPTPTTAYTVSAWLRWQGSLPISDIKVGIAYGDGNPNTLWMGYFSDGKLAVSNSSVDLKSSTVINSGTWHHVVGVLSGGTLTGYIDGVSIGSTATGARGADTLKMGDYISASLPWTGLIDEVRVYNRPLSAAEVLALYNATKRTKYNASSTTLGNGSTLTNGLVGWWTFDGSTISGTTATDSSGKGNSGTLVSSPVKIAGKLGQALRFNGTNYVSLGHVQDGGTNFTWTAWINTTQAVTPLNFYNKPNIVGTLEGSGFGNDAELGVYNGKLAFYDEFSGAANDVVTNSAVNDGKWHQVAVTRSGTSLIFYVDGANVYTASTGSNALNSLGFEIARATYDGAVFFNGSIDDVRIYNRALSAGEMQQLYQEGGAKVAGATTLSNGTTLVTGLLGYWSFNGPDVTDKVYDRSGQGNNGYFYNSATSTAKVAGKLGQALQFNGTSNEVFLSTAPSNTTFTISAWINIGNLNSGYRTIYANDSKGLWLRANHIDWYDGGDRIAGGTSITPGKWHQIVVTYDGTTMTTYVDSVNDGSGSFSTSLPTISGGAVGIGGHNLEYFNGTIDEVRVYNRALSATEVAQLYQLGK